MDTPDHSHSPGLRPASAAAERAPGPVAPNREEIERGLRLLCAPGEAAWLIATDTSGAMASMYFNDLREMAGRALAASQQGRQLTLLLNPVDTGLVAQFDAVRRQGACVIPESSDITRVRFVCVEVAPVREATGSPTTQQLELARAASTTCQRAMREGGLPAPSVVWDGATYNLLYRTDMPPDPELLGAIQSGLTTLIEPYATPEVQFSAITAADFKILLPGTVNLAIGQLVRIVKEPAQQALLTLQLLEAAQASRHANAEAPKPKGAQEEPSAADQEPPRREHTEEAADPPIPDGAEMLHALRLLLTPGGIIELRALGKGSGKVVAAGYFDTEHLNQLVQIATELNRNEHAHIHVTLNTPHPQLLARYTNRVVRGREVGVTTSDADIIRRRLLFVDIDPVRPRETSVTDEQLASVEQVRDACLSWLKDAGWPAPVVQRSGNGYYLMYAIDEPNDPATAGIIKGCLEALNAQHGTQNVKIDVSGANAARICRLAGTVNTKGDHSAMYPWRLAKILNPVPQEPFEQVRVTREQLEQLAALAPQPEPRRTNEKGGSKGYAWTHQQVEDFMRRAGLEWTGPEGFIQSDGGAGTRWKIKVCPYNEGHTNCSVVLQFTNGALCFTCRHDSCRSYKWQDLREKVDGPRDGREPHAKGFDPKSDPFGADGGTSSGDQRVWRPPHVHVYGADFDPAKIPRRQWLLGERRALGEVTCDAGPPMSNKSTLMLQDAISIATGRQTLQDQVHQSGPVLFLAGEDSRRDVEARLAGILQHYKIRPAELDGRLQVVYLDEGDPARYSLAHMERDIGVANEQMFEWLREYAAIAVFIDPLAAWSRLMENSNEAQSLFGSLVKGLAVRGKRHVGFDHHVNKAHMGDAEAHVGNLASVRGAGAIVAFGRWAFTMARLNKATADQYGLDEEERKRYRRLDPLKYSYLSDGTPSRLLRVESVIIANMESVGVLAEVDPASMLGRAQETRRSAEEAFAYEFPAALSQMIEEQGAVSLRAATVWLTTRFPHLFLDRRTQQPLRAETIRQKLPALIAEGLPCMNKNGEERRLVLVPGGRSTYVDFAPVGTGS